MHVCVCEAPSLPSRHSKMSGRLNRKQGKKEDHSEHTAEVMQAACCIIHWKWHSAELVYWLYT